MIQGEEIFGIIYEKGAVVFHQGDPGDVMYIIQSGAVEVSRIQGEQKVVFALLEQGDFFGEMALIDRRPRSATVTTISRSRLLPLTRDSLMDRMRSDPGVVLHLLRTLSQRIGQSSRLLRTMVQGDEAMLSISEGGQEENAEKFKHSDVENSEKTKILSTRETSVLKESLISSVQEKIVLKAMHFCENQERCFRFKAGETIFQQGDLGDSMYIIVEGEVEISQRSDNDRYVLARLRPGEFFGEIAIITTQPRTATAISTKDTLLLPIQQEEFFNRIKVEPDLGLYILQVLIIRLRMLLSAMEFPEKTSDELIRSFPPPLKKEGLVKVAFISLSSCGGCPAVLLEDQEELIRLLEKVNISFCPLLIDECKIGKVEVAIVDGAVRVKEDEEKLIDVRRKSRYLLAWGTCASLGGIPAFANQYELEELIEESYGQAQDPFAYYLSGTLSVDRGTYQERELKLLRRAGKLDDFVRVDYYLPGCPPKVNFLIQFISELKGEGQIIKTKPIVCAECSRKRLKMEVDYFRVFPRPEWTPNHCFISQGAICMGFMTKGGCGAICPRGGLPCWGCRGPSETALKKLDEGNSFEESILTSLVSHFKQIEDQIKSVMRIARKQGNSSLIFYQNFFFNRSRIR